MLEKSLQTKQTKIPVIKDTLFNNGVSLVGTKSKNLVTGVFIYPFGKSQQEASWKLTEWGSKYGLSKNDKLIIGDTVFYQNKGKKAGFYRSNEGVAISLELFGANEYSTPRESGGSWPHLLLEQSISEPLFLTKMNSLICNIQAKLVYAENHMNSTDFDPKLHTCHVTLFFSVGNINKNSNNYRDYFWFGLPIYDYRYDKKERYMAQDTGKKDSTKKFIFTLSTNEVFGNSSNNDKWMKANIDVLSKIREGFEIAKQRGYLKESNWEDMAVGSINIGWETPGTFNSKIILKGLSLNAYVDY